MEYLESDGGKFHLKHRLVDRGDTWEFWQGFREIALLRYKAASEFWDFHGEWLGWNRISNLYFEIDVPSGIMIGGRVLDSDEIADLAGRVHLTLCSMNERNVVVQKANWPTMPESQRDAEFLSFKKWMENRGWTIEVNREAGKLSIKRKRFQISRKPGVAEILEQGSRVAVAYRALHDGDSDKAILFISEDANYSSSPLYEINW